VVTNVSDEHTAYIIRFEAYIEAEDSPENIVLPPTALLVVMSEFHWFLLRYGRLAQGPTHIFQFSGTFTE
jgi:hypothetical protein